MPPRATTSPLWPLRPTAAHGPSLDPVERLTAALEWRRERLLREVERHQAFAARVPALTQHYRRMITHAPGGDDCLDDRLKRSPSEAEIARNLRAGRH